MTDYLSFEMTTERRVAPLEVAAVISPCRSLDQVQIIQTQEKRYPCFQPETCSVFQIAQVEDDSRLRPILVMLSAWRIKAGAQQQILMFVEPASSCVDLPLTELWVRHIFPCPRYTPAEAVFLGTRLLDFFCGDKKAGLFDVRW